MTINSQTLKNKIIEIIESQKYTSNFDGKTIQYNNEKFVIPDARNLTRNTILKLR